MILGHFPKVYTIQTLLIGIMSHLKMQLPTNFKQQLQFPTFRKKFHKNVEFQYFFYLMKYTSFKSNNCLYLLTYSMEQSP